MDINGLLRQATKFKDAEDAEKLIEREDFESSVRRCVDETIKGFPADHDGIMEKRAVFDSGVFSGNKEHVYNLSGTIAIMFSFLAIFELLDKTNKTVDACLRIYRRMLTISQEILCLSMSGFPDGSFSRWRSLYENSIIIKLLIRNNEELSSRFLKHSVVSRKNLNDMFDKMLKTKTSIQEEDLYEKYIAEFGKSFKENYGWLLDVIPEKKNRTFSNICKIVGDEKALVPFYKLSCKVLHANSFSSDMYMGQFGDVIPVGPSEHGNASPIYLTINTALGVVGHLTEYAYGKSSVGIFLINYIVQIQLGIADSFKVYL